MKRIIRTSMFVALVLSCNAAFAADDCTKLTVTGHPQYPVIAYKEGDRIDGAAPRLVEAIAKELKIPVESKFTGSWADAQAATREGKADIIVGVYFNDERATYLDYVRPAFIFDQVVLFVAKGKSFPFSGRQDLIGKKGVTNKGESYGSELDSYIEEKLTVDRSDGVDAAFRDLLSGKAEYAIAGYYPGLAIAEKMGVKDKVELVKSAVLSTEMFIAFSKKSPCRSLSPKFGQQIAAITTDGRFNKMLTEEMIEWGAAQQPKR
jgi:polar amino acid transport system substrate-binding protein